MSGTGLCTGWVVLENPLTTTRCTWSSLAPPRAHIRLLQRSLCTCALLYGVCTSQSAFKTHVLAHLHQDQVDCDDEDQRGDDEETVEEVQKVLTLARGADHDETLSTHCKGVHQQHICKPPPTRHWPHSCCNNSLQQITPTRSNVLFPLLADFLFLGNLFPHS